MSDIVFINGVWIKKFEFPNGGSKHNVSIQVENFCNQMKQLQNEKGYVYLEMKQRREPDDKGNTHYLCLSTFKPGEKNESAPAQQQSQQARTEHRRSTPDNPPVQDEPKTAFDDMPF